MADSRALAPPSIAYEQQLVEARPKLAAFFRQRLAGRAEDCEDLVQDVMLAAFHARSGYDGSRPLINWVYGIARNKLRDHRRQLYRRSVALAPDDRATLSTDHAVVEARLSVEQLLRRLSPEDRHAVAAVRLGQCMRHPDPAPTPCHSALRVRAHRAVLRLGNRVGREAP